MLQYVYFSHYSTPQSDCLDDRPRQVAELKFPDKLPGELYNADIQCKWQFGSRARLCTYDFGKVGVHTVCSVKVFNKPQYVHMAHTCILSLIVSVYLIEMLSPGCSFIVFIGQQVFS